MGWILALLNSELDALVECMVELNGELEIEREKRACSRWCPRTDFCLKVRGVALRRNRSRRLRDRIHRPAWDGGNVHRLRFHRWELPEVTEKEDAHPTESLFTREGFLQPEIDMLKGLQADHTFLVNDDILGVLKSVLKSL
jgi:hypothetical protein